VDRSAAYITRYLAKNVVAAGLATRCTIQIAYAIGVSEPLSLYVDTHGTGAAGIEEKLEAALPRLVRLTPKGIRTHLALNKPIYQPTAAYGHFGRKAEGDLFTWERTDLADAIRQSI
jgi:S-adenosylmethionine synthetase